MKKKDTENQLSVAQTAWETFDNLGDKVIEETVEGVTSDILSSLPLGSIVMGAYKGFKHYKEKQRFKNFIVFIQSYKTKTERDINQYLKDNPTSELGEYTLSMLEELSSARQTEMLGRATALLLNGVINEDTFFEYGYIISKLDPHLFTLVVELKDRYFKDEYGRDDLQKKWLSIQARRSVHISNPNQDLLSFGFLAPVPIKMEAGMEKLPEQKYEVTAKYKKFYDMIITGEKCTTSQKRK